MSAIVPDGGDGYAAYVETAAADMPLPFDFLEFLEHRLDVDRATATALLRLHVRTAWDLGSQSELATMGPS